MISYAYWLLPKRINGVSFIKVPTRHINDIIKHPKKFGETKKSIESEYNKYNEPIGLEGKAREQIIERVLKRGFGRIRFDMRSQIWSIQIWSLSRKMQDRIFEFAMDASKQRNVSKESNVFIHLLNNNKMLKTTLKDIMIGKNLNENISNIDDIREQFFNGPDYNDYFDEIDESLLSDDIKLLYEESNENN